MSDNLFYKLGRGSLKEAKETLRKLLEDIGEVAVYLDESSLFDVYAAINELHILTNIEYLRGDRKKPASINIDLLLAYIKSKNKIIVSDRDIEKLEEEVL